MQSFALSSLALALMLGASGCTLGTPVAQRPDAQLCQDYGATVCTNTPRTFVSGRADSSPAAVGAADQFAGRWQGDTPAIAAGCDVAGMQFQVSGNRISGTGIKHNWYAGGFQKPSPTMTGTIDRDGVGTIEWNTGERGTIKFTGDRFEARMAVLPCNRERVFSGGRT